MSVPLAKLSERFYQKFGHDSVEELVNWLNQMDTTYRTDLREVNELNFARFDAKLEQRLAELRADLRQEIAAQGRDLTKIGGELRTEMADLRTDMADLRTDMADLRTDMAAHRAELIKWIVGCGLGAVTVLGGLMFTLLRYFHP
jgi:predicted  nucleic acid-binding Zn-ribbon protein